MALCAILYISTVAQKVKTVVVATHITSFGTYMSPGDQVEETDSLPQLFILTSGATPNASLATTSHVSVSSGGSGGGGGGSTPYTIQVNKKDGTSQIFNTHTLDVIRSGIDFGDSATFKIGIGNYTDSANIFHPHANFNFAEGSYVDATGNPTAVFNATSYYGYHSINCTTFKVTGGSFNCVNFVRWNAGNYPTGDLDIKPLYVYHTGVGISISRWGKNINITTQMCTNYGHSVVLEDDNDGGYDYNSNVNITATKRWINTSQLASFYNNGRYTTHLNWNFKGEFQKTDTAGEATIVFGSVLGRSIFTITGLVYCGNWVFGSVPPNTAGRAIEMRQDNQDGIINADIRGDMSLNACGTISLYGIRWVGTTTFGGAGNFNDNMSQWATSNVVTTGGNVNMMGADCRMGINHIPNIGYVWLYTVSNNYALISKQKKEITIKSKCNFATHTYKSIICDNDKSHSLLGSNVVFERGWDISYDNEFGNTAGDTIIPYAIASDYRGQDSTGKPMRYLEIHGDVTNHMNYSNQPLIKLDTGYLKLVDCNIVNEATGCLAWCIQPLDNKSIIESNGGKVDAANCQPPINSGYHDSVSVKLNNYGNLWLSNAKTDRVTLVKQISTGGNVYQDKLFGCDTAGWTSCITPPIPTPPSGMLLWLKADAGVTKDGSDFVSNWADQSGNGYDAVQATGSNQPKYVANVLNGQPCIRFDGSDDFLISNITSSYPQPITIYYVFTVRGTGSQFVASLPSTYYIYAMTYNGVNDLYMTDDYYNIVETGITPPVTRFYGCNYQGASSQLWKNGVYYTNGTQMSVNFTGNYNIGRTTYLGGSSYLNGDIEEILVYPSTITTTAAAMKAYVDAKYGTLP